MNELAKKGSVLKKCLTHLTDKFNVSFNFRFTKKRRGKMEELVCLRKMKKNSSGVIKKINGSKDMERRFRDIGLFSGVWFRLEGRAPLKDPVALRLKNCKITLRNNEADIIMVEPRGGDL